MITGGYIGLNHKRLAQRMVPTDGWRQNYVFVATPLLMPSGSQGGGGSATETKLVALRYSLSQTHLSAQSFFMGWSKKLGAHTDNSDRCTPAEWFSLEPVPGEETVFAVRHFESSCLLSVARDATVGFAPEGTRANVDAAVQARTSGVDEVALVQIEVLESKPEFDVVFTSHQLGLRVSRTVPLLVRAFTRNAPAGAPGASGAMAGEKGEVGEAERIGSVCLGDAIVAVQGVDVRSSDRRSVLRAIADGERPLTVRFRCSLPEDDPSLMGSPDRESFERILMAGEHQGQ